MIKRGKVTMKVVNVVRMIVLRRKIRRKMSHREPPSTINSRMKTIPLMNWRSERR